VSVSTYNLPVTHVPDPNGADGRGVSGGGGNPPVVYTTDPNTENLKPADVNAPGFAYAASGSGAIFGWNIDLQKWL